MSKKIQIVNVTKKKNKFIVSTNEKEYTFCEDTIIKYYIFKGKEFTEEEFDEALKAEKENSYLNQALNFISFQTRSIREIVDYLKSKDATKEQSEYVITKLIELGYLDDEVFSKNMLDSIMLKKKGPMVLLEKLKAKGVDEGIIKNALSLYTIDLEEEILNDIIKSLVKKNNDQPKQKQKQIIYTKLLRDGFTSSLVSRLVDKIEFVDESEETLIKNIEKLKRKYPLKEDKNKIVASLLSKGYEYRKIQEKL